MSYREYISKLSELAAIGSSMVTNIKFNNLNKERLLDLANRFEILFDQLIAKEGV